MKNIINNKKVILTVMVIGIIVAFIFMWYMFCNALLIIITSYINIYNIMSFIVKLLCILKYILLIKIIILLTMGFILLAYRSFKNIKKFKYLFLPYSIIIIAVLFYYPYNRLQILDSSLDKKDYIKINNFEFPTLKQKLGYKKMIVGITSNEYTKKNAIPYSIIIYKNNITQNELTKYKYNLNDFGFTLQEYGTQSILYLERNYKVGIVRIVENKNTIEIKYAVINGNYKNNEDDIINGYYLDIDKYSYLIK